MDFSPAPLESGTTLDERFQLERSLGQGGFGITYLAHDHERGDLCVVKELAPVGCRRSEDGVTMQWEALGPAQANRLRQQFEQEAKVLRSLPVPGVCQVRSVFAANATAYFVTNYLEGSRTLSRLLQQSGTLSGEEVEELIQKICHILGPIHERQILHRDLTPSNILIKPNGDIVLIDFGAARQWHQDRTHNQTVVYSPGFAPIEQLSERARRGPQTDIYALCACAFQCLTGEPPPPATDRLESDILLWPKQATDIPPLLKNAIEAGLRVRMQERPPTVEALVRLLGAEEIADQDSLEDLDQRRALLKHFRPGKRACPSCDGVLETVKPFNKGTCGVCTRATIVKRKIDEGRCPVCKAGFLRPWIYRGGRPLICPACKVGHLHGGGLKLPWAEQKSTCDHCPAVYREKNGKVLVDGVEEATTWEELYSLAGRSSHIEQCDACAAQFDMESDGRLRQVEPKPKLGAHKALFPDEWSRVAAGLRPDQGNAECPACHADYFEDATRVTLLDAADGPYRFSEHYLGRPLTFEAMRWCAAGKSSGNPGLLCKACLTEFDTADGGQLSLAHTEHPVLRSYVDRTDDLVNFQRLARRLPLVGHEDELDEQVDLAITRAYVEGQLPLDERHPDILWRGPAVVDAKELKLIVQSSHLELKRILRSERIDLDDLRYASAEDDNLELRFPNRESLNLVIVPIERTIRLKSGSRKTVLGAEALAAAINFSRQIRR